MHLSSWHLNRRAVAAGLCACALHGGHGAALAQSGAQGRPQARRRYCSDASAPTDGPAVTLAEWQHGLAIWVRRDAEHMAEFFGSGARIRILTGTNDAFADQGGVIGLGDRLLMRAGAERLDRITAIMAHEHSHIFQMRANVDRMLRDVKRHPVKFVELHADYLAGSYFGWLRQRRQVDEGALARLFFDLGDTHFESDQHHGTRHERFVAFANGFNDFKAAQASRPDAIAAATMGIKYVQSLL